MNKTFIVQTKDGLIEWNLNSKCRKVVKPIADEFGMAIERFLTLYSLHRLPGQLPSRAFCEEQDRACDIEIKFDLDQLKKSPVWKRIKRAAQLSGQSVSEFIQEALMETVRSCEEDVILSPRTGKIIGDDHELFQFISLVNRTELHES